MRCLNAVIRDPIPTGGRSGPPAAAGFPTARPVRRTLSLLAVLAILSLAAAGCGAGEATTGTLSVQMTDDPVDRLRAVRVALGSISVVPSRGEPAIIATDIGTYDLLALEGRRETLVEVELPPGHYHAMLVRLDPRWSEVVGPDGETEPLRLATEETFVRGGGFRIEPGSETRLLLDFDVDESLISTPAGWLLNPVIRIASLSERSLLTTADAGAR